MGNARKPPSLIECEPNKHLQLIGRLFITLNACTLEIQRRGVI